MSGQARNDGIAIRVCSRHRIRQEKVNAGQRSASAFAHRSIPSPAKRGCLFTLPDARDELIRTAHSTTSVSPSSIRGLPRIVDISGVRCKHRLKYKLSYPSLGTGGKSITISGGEDRPSCFFSTKETCASANTSPLLHGLYSRQRLWIDPDRSIHERPLSGRRIR